MKHDLNGSGVYKHQVPEPPLKPRKIKKHPPVELQAVIVDGEVYLRAKDICINLQRAALCFPSISLSVLNFAKCFVLNLIQLKEDKE